MADHDLDRERQAGGRSAAILRHLPYFLAVAEGQTLQAAAERMNIAPSALSRRIRLLEQELGDVALFARTPRGMRLLPTGAALLEETRALLAGLERARAQIGALAAGRIGLVRLGFVEVTTRRKDIMDALNAFAHEAPGIELDLRPMLAEEARRDLAAGELDAALLYHDPAEDIAADIGAAGGAPVAALPILRDAFILAVPAQSRLARPEGIVLADIGAEPVIWSSHKRGPRLYDRMLSACEARGFSPRIVMETPASDITMKFVGADMGVGFVPESLIGHQPANVALVRIHDFHVVMQLSLVWRVTAPGEALAAFIDFLAPRIERPDFDKLES